MKNLPITNKKTWKKIDNGEQIYYLLTDNTYESIYTTNNKNYNCDVKHNINKYLNDDFMTFKEGIEILWRDINLFNI